VLFSQTTRREPKILGGGFFSEPVRPKFKLLLPITAHHVNPSCVRIALDLYLCEWIL